MLLVVGFILYVVMGLLHPDGPGPFESKASHRAPIDDPNGPTARSNGWTEPWDCHHVPRPRRRALPAERDVLRERKMNARHEDVPGRDIPRYTWLLSRYPNFLASFIRPFREVAVKRFRLQWGAESRCGVRNRKQFPFPSPSRRSGRRSRGVEISPDLAAIARKRIEQEE